MNDMRLEGLLGDVLADVAAERVPDLLAPGIALTTSRIRQRARWLALLRERPMRLHSGLAVGSPTLRLAGLMALMALLFALVLGGAVVGASLLPSPTVLGDPPYLTKFCDLASLDEVRAILGDGSTTVAHGLGRSRHTGLQSCVWRADVPGERHLGVWDWAPSMFDEVKVQPDAYVQDARLMPLADLGDDAFLLTSPSEADLFIKKGARATQVFYRPTGAEDTARMQAVVTQMGTLVAERISGAPSAGGDLCQLLTPDDIRASLQWTLGPDDTIGARSFATHCDWIGMGATDYLEVYDVPVPDFDAARSRGGEPVSGMGDEAYILTVDDQPTLYIRKGDRAAAISTPHYNDAVQQYGPEDELKIGAIVADRLAAAASGTPSTHLQSEAPSSPVTWVPAEPNAVFDVPNAAGVISLATDGATVWVMGQGEILRIDGATGTVDHLPAPVATDDTSALWADDSLWVARWSAGKLYRLDPTTGAVELAIDLPHAVDPQLVGQDLWVGREDRHEMVKVDRTTGALGASVGQGAYGVSSQGALWFSGRSDPPTVLRVDPSSGATVATIQVPPGTGCAIGATTGGTPPDALFTSGCLARTAETRPFTRIDPRTNSVIGTMELPAAHGAGPVVAGTWTWLVGSFQGADGAENGGIVHLDPVTGTGQEWYSLPGVAPDGGLGVGMSIWIPDEAGHRVLRYDIASLRSLYNGVQP